MSTNTPNMNLLTPTIGIDTGLTWEQAFNSNTTIIDQHNHASGSGVQIPSAGININTALPFNNNAATNLSSVIFTDQPSLATLNALYTVAGELWFNDPSGAVQITAAGAVNATSSGIASGSASASFSTGVLVVNAASNTPANIQGGSILLGNNSSGSKFLTLAPPGAMASNFSLTLPSIPGAQSFMAIDTSGNFSAYAAVSGGITGSMIGSNTVTRANQVYVGQQISSSCGAFSTTSTTFASVTNLSVTITTSARPVVIFLQPAATTSAYLSPGSTNVLYLELLSGVTVLAQWVISTGTAAPAFPPSTVFYLDTPIAGTYTYTIKAKVSSGTGYIENCVLCAYEL